MISSVSDPSESDGAKFPTGSIVATRGILEVVPMDEIRRALIRHISGDWGNLDKEDKASNDRALIEGARLFSAYNSESNVRFWIITEADRSATTVLLPSEY